MDNKKKVLLNKIVFIYIIIQPILDAISGISNNISFLNIKINVIIRGLFLLLVSFYLLFICKNKYRKFNLIYFGLFLLYFSLYAYVTFLYKDKSLILFELKQSIMTFYFPIVLLACFNMKEDKIIEFNDKPFVIALTIYILLIIIPNLFGISFDAYDDGVGKLGFFNTANSISAILSMLLPCVFIYFKDKIKYLIVFLILFILCIVSMGTKAVILCLLIVLFINGIYYFNKNKAKFNGKKKIILIATIIVIIGSLVIVAPKTAVYKNIKRRIEFLEIKDTDDVIENFDALVMSRRIKFLKDVNKIYLKANFPQKSVGIGHNFKLIEMDYFDIFYSNGFLGFIIFFLPFIYIVKYSYKKKAKNFITINRFSSLLIILLTSFLTGHVLIEPNASFYAALIILMFF